MDALVLHIDSFWISPYAMSAFVALEEKRLDYTLHEVSLANGEQKKASYLSRTGRVPALQHGDYWLAESIAIAEYVAETFPCTDGRPRIFPADLKERGICREVMGWLRSDLMPIREERATHTIWYEHTRTPLSAAGEQAKAKLVAACDRLIDADRTTLFKEWCIADADLSLMLQRLHTNGDDLPKKLCAYADANWQRPSIHKWNSHARRPYVAY
jgi:glutathione S-transferase